MNVWLYKWIKNGWTNHAGNEVANRDLIEKAWKMILREKGDVEYIWIPRREYELADELADELCNKRLREEYGLCDY